MSDNKQIEGYSQITQKLATRGYYGPTNIFPGVETWVAGAKMASGGKAAYEVSKSVREAMESRHPLLVTIYQTFTDEDGHELVMKIENLSRHGLYLEKISLKDPERDHIDVEIGEIRQHSRLIESKESGRTFPFLLEFEQVVSIRVRFPLFDGFRMKNRDYGKLSIRYLLAGDLKGRQEKEQIFSVLEKSS